jgi:transcriptional regulator with XRE-family HTH domain
MANALVERVKARRRKMKITQVGLAEISDVSFGSVKRFETTGQISLKSLIKIALVLKCEKDIEALFKRRG